MSVAACTLCVSHKETQVALPHMSVIDVFCSFSFLFLFGEINEFQV